MQKLEALNRATALALENSKLEEQMLRLWQLLDEIEIVDAMAGADDATFRAAVNRLHKKRLTILSREEFDRLRQAEGDDR